MKTISQEDSSQPLEEIIRRKLEKALIPSFLEIINESHKHQGHAGYKPDSHFKINIASPLFTNQSPIHNHQQIYNVLKQEMEHKIHALSITCLKED